MDKRTQNLRATKAGRRAPPPSTLVLWGEQLTPLPFGSQKQIQLTKLAIWGGWEEQRRGTCFISYWFSELNQLIKQLQPGQGEQNFLFAVWISWALPRQTINNVSASLKHTASTNKLFLKRKNNKKKPKLNSFEQAECVYYAEWWAVQMIHRLSPPASSGDKL